MSASPVPAIIDGLVAVLAASPDLAGVTIRSGPFDATGVTEVLQLSEITITDDQESMGLASRGLEFDVQGIIECVQFGAGEEVISAARARAFAILDAVETTLIAGLTVSGVDLRYAEIRTERYIPSLIDGGHRGHLEFSLHFMAGLG